MFVFLRVLIRKCEKKFLVLEIRLLRQPWDSRLYKNRTATLKVNKIKV